MDRDVMAEIKEAVTRHRVVLYMKGTQQEPRCGFSAAAVEVLRDIGVPFKDFDVLEDPELRQAIKVYSDWPTLPQLYVGGEFVGGADIVREMHANGELAPLIHAAAGDPERATS